MKFNWQSAALRLVAIGFAALLLVLLVSGIQAIAKINLINVPAAANVRSPGDLAAFPPLPNLREFPDPLSTDWRRVPFPVTSRRRATPSAAPAPSPAIAPSPTMRLSLIFPHRNLLQPIRVILAIG